jgi:hypothetical protein
MTGPFIIRHRFGFAVGLNAARPRENRQSRLPSRIGGSFFSEKATPIDCAQICTRLIFFRRRNTATRSRVFTRAVRSAASASERTSCTMPVHRRLSRADFALALALAPWSHWHWGRCTVHSPVAPGAGGRSLVQDKLPKLPRSKRCGGAPKRPSSLARHSVVCAAQRMSSISAGSVCCPHCIRSEAGLLKNAHRLSFTSENAEMPPLSGVSPA